MSGRKKQEKRQQLAKLRMSQISANNFTVEKRRVQRAIFEALHVKSDRKPCMKNKCGMVSQTC